MANRSPTRLWRGALLGLTLAVSVPTLVDASGEPPPEQGDATAPTGPTETSTPVTSTTLPPGCARPRNATAVFVGEVTAKDARTARFRVEQVRAGSLDGYEVTGLVDVDYPGEVTYLEVGERYLVGAAGNSISGRLISAVREPAPLFGGNQVVGVNDSDVDCPVFEDPVRTLMLDGRPVESGVFAPFLEDEQGILRALLLPAVWFFLALVGVAALKDLLWASGRELRRLVSGGERRTAAGPRRGG